MNQEKPFVTTYLYSQLGNQLYQISTTLAYAWDYQVDAFFPALHQEHLRLSYNRDKIFFRLNASPLPRNFSHYYKEAVYYSSARVPFRKDLLINGYFQSWKHFDHHRQKLLAVFAPSDEVLSKLNRKYSDLLKNPKVVGLQVRTHNKLFHETKLHPFVGFDYYREAIKRFPSDSTFAVFSDRIEWCRECLPKELSAKMIFIEGNDHIEDLFLLSMLPNLIIGNSTFGWWAGYFNQLPEKRVVAPRYWRDPLFYPGFPVSDYFPKGWELLDTGFDHPYPEKMAEMATQSVDN